MREKKKRKVKHETTPTEGNGIEIQETKKEAHPV